MLFVITLLISFSAFSAPPPQSEHFASQNSKKIAYFKTKQSPFPSGHSSLERLLGTLVSEEKNESFYFLKEQKKISPSLVPYVTAFHLSKTWIDKTTRKRVPADNSKNLNDILTQYETDPRDRGLILTLKESKLKSEPQIKSASTEIIPALSYFIPISFEKGFVKILYKKKFGYIDINDCISKFDFTRFVYSVKSKIPTWDAVDHREFDHIVSDDNKYISLNDIGGLLVNEKLAYIFKTNDHYPIWTKLFIEQEKNPLWHQSNVKGHGLVWWKKPITESVSEQNISVDEIMKKDIYSVSFQSAETKRGLISTRDGVFITSDGQNWHALSQFKDYAGPVYYHNDTLLFIGNYRSLDGGKTFENYIQVDKISEAIEKQVGSQPRRIKITKIRVQKPLSLLIDVDTGTKKVRLKSPLFAQDWKPYRL